MKLILTLLFSLNAMAAVPTNERDMSNVDEMLKDLNTRIAKVKKEKMPKGFKPQDKEWVRAKINAMVEIDQMVRNLIPMITKDRFNHWEIAYFWQKFSKVMPTMDKQNTQELKKILKHYNWLTISEFGPEVDRNAWLLVQHADHDRNFQKQVLKILRPLAKKEETGSSNYAYLYDRIRAGEGLPQRYATQGECQSGLWVPHKVENLAQVNKLRDEIGLETLDEYANSISELYCN